MTTGVLDVERDIETTPAEAAEPRVRAAIAVLMTSFPRIDETFILREIEELERLGQPVLVVPVNRAQTDVVHEQAKPWLKRALFVPLLSFAVLRSNVIALARDPLRYLRVLARLIGGTSHRGSTLVQTVALFPKAVHLARILPRRGIRHLHAHFASHATTMAYVISSFSDITYSFTVYGPDVFVHRLLLREKIRRARFVRSTSIFNQAFLHGLYPVETERKIDVVRSGVNPDVYAEAAARARRTSARPMLLTVAAMTPSRGFEFLVDACARLIKSGVDLDCRIVGDGPTRVDTQAWIARHGISDSMRLLGALPQHEIARLMGETDIFVLPSIIAMDGQMDGIPTVLLEAMAAGKPVIASAISGIPELVAHDVDGLLVDAANVERLAFAIRRLIEDPALRERLGRTGQAKVRQHFDLRRNAESLIALFDRQHGINVAPRTAAERVMTLAWSRLNVCAVGVRRFDERPDAFVAEAAITDGIRRRDVIIRQPRAASEQSARERARVEFEIATLLRRSMTPLSETAGLAQEYSVPRVLLFDETRAALVTERADGVSLARFIAEARTRGRVRRLAIALRKTGTWLRLMQGHTRSDDDGRYVLTATVVVALRDLDLAAAGDRAIRQQRGAIIERLQSLESRLAAGPLPVVGHHGNYGPDNVFLGERRVDVIDFGSYRDGLPLEDAARMLVELEVRSWNPLLRRHLPTLRRSFLDGYGGRNGAIDGDALRLFTIAKALQLLARGGTIANPLRDWSRRRALRQIIARSVAA